MKNPVLNDEERAAAMHRMRAEPERREAIIKHLAKVQPTMVALYLQGNEEAALHLVIASFEAALAGADLEIQLIKDPGGKGGAVEIEVVAVGDPNVRQDN